MGLMRAGQLEAWELAIAAAIDRLCIPAFYGLSRSPARCGLDPADDHVFRSHRSTWNPGIVREASSIIAEEARGPAVHGATHRHSSLSSTTLPG